MYHGWRYDGTGQCVEQPGEDEGPAARVKIASYPVEEYLGLIFAYLGEGDPPPIRRFPDFERDFVIETGVPEAWPCNYFNRLDNAADRNHVMWTHRESLSRTGGSATMRPIWGEETEYGARTATTMPDGSVTYTHFHMPNINQTRSSSRVEGALSDTGTGLDRLFWRVPVDDEHSISFIVDCVHLSGEAAESYRERRRQSAETTNTELLNGVGEAVLAGKMRVRDMDATWSTYKTFWIEDYAVQCGQVAIADRSNERPIRIDAGMLFLRKLWERELLKVATGRPIKRWTTPAGLAEMPSMRA
ncbi:MAG: pobA 2 [Chloroflexi bacterium]|nr:pobA 2 [Chloroflexota bacterium]